MQRTEERGPENAPQTSPGFSDTRLPGISIPQAPDVCCRIIPPDIVHLDLRAGRIITAVERGLQASIDQDSIIGHEFKASSILCEISAIQTHHPIWQGNQHSSPIRLRRTTVDERDNPIYSNHVGFFRDSIGKNRNSAGK